MNPALRFYAEQAHAITRYVYIPQSKISPVLGLPLLRIERAPLVTTAYHSNWVHFAPCHSSSIPRPIGQRNQKIGAPSPIGVPTHPGARRRMAGSSGFRKNLSAPKTPRNCHPQIFLPPQKQPRGRRRTTAHARQKAAWVAAPSLLSSPLLSMQALRRF